MPFVSAVVLLAAALFAALPAPLPEPPVRIVRCGVLSRSLLLDPFNGMRVERVRAAALDFVDLRATAATRVTVSLSYQGTADSAVITGTFTPGVAIHREVAAFTDLPYGGDAASCTLRSVAFADGTVWRSLAEP